MPVSTVSMLLPMAEPLPVIAATAVLLVVLVRARTELLSMLAATTELLGVLVRAKEVMLSTLAATTQLPVVLAHVPTELLLMLATTTELLSVLATTEQLAVLVRATTELLFMLAATTQLLSMLLAPTAERLSVLTTTMELLSMLVLTTGLLSLLVPTTELLPVLAETTELLSTLPVPATEPLSASAPTTELLSLLVPATELLSLLVPATEPMSVPVRAMTKLLPLPVPTGPLFVVVPTMLLMLVPATELLYMLVPVKPSLGLCSVSASASAMLPRRTQLARPSRGRCSAAVPMPVVMKLQLVRMPTAKLLLAPAPGTTKLLSMLVPTTGLQSVLVPATELLYMLVPVKPSHGLCSIAALPRRTTGETLTWSLFRADGTAATRGTCVLPQPADPTGEALTWSLFRAGGTVCDAVPPRLGGTAVGVGVDTASISHTDSGTPGLAGPLTRDREHAMWNLFREPLYVTAAECRRDSGGAPPFACPVRWVVHHTAATPGGVPGLLPIAASGGVKSRWALSTCVARHLRPSMVSRHCCCVARSASSHSRRPTSGRVETSTFPKLRRPLGSSSLARAARVLRVLLAPIEATPPTSTAEWALRSTRSSAAPSTSLPQTLPWWRRLRGTASPRWNTSSAWRLSTCPPPVVPLRQRRPGRCRACSPRG